MPHAVVGMYRPITLPWRAAWSGSGAAPTGITGPSMDRGWAGTGDAVSEVGAPQVLAGRYEVGPVLGQGGMARVCRGTDTVLGRAVAIKLFRADVDPADASRIATESRTLAVLNHPGLVGVYDAGISQDGTDATPFLVMELVDGPTLASCCLDGSLSAAEVARIGADLAEALAHVHANGVVHRDVKPANILLDASRRAKLTDFGIARIVDSARHTATGLTIGTAPYLSPEQVTGAAVGPPTDVYALGLVLLECLTGRREYPGNGVESALARLHRPPAIPAELAAPWPELIAAMTAEAPQDRPGAGDVAAALRSSGALTGAVPAAVTAVLPRLDPPAGMPLRPIRRPTRPGPAGPGRRLSALVDRIGLAGSIALVAAVLLVAIIALILLIAGGSGSPTPKATPGGSAPAGSQLDRDLRDLTSAVTP